MPRDKQAGNFKLSGQRRSIVVDPAKHTIDSKSSIKTQFRACSPATSPYRLNEYGGVTESPKRISSEHFEKMNFSKATKNF